MDLKTAIETRTSVREFLSEPVNPQDIKEIIRLAGLAPSINNYQPWRYISITNSELLRKMAEAVSHEIARMPENDTRMARQLKSQTAWFSTFFSGAPMLIALAGHPFDTDLNKGVNISNEELDRIRNYPDLQSSGASIQNLLLAATSLGYGSCWMTGPLFAREKIEKLLNLEAPWKLISFVAIGKPAKANQKLRDKRNLADEMIFID